ncbi:Hypothetical predicted protein [Octopus vulgaris]|uniref:Uncharacterized protein n=1 Tax=Octopus vulgaris TaxID=6645 RepID=A0AA36AJV3_OCTVU|nr:Hypothetical predicted protein [Octopus vulgaris]
MAAQVRLRLDQHRNNNNNNNNNKHKTTIENGDMKQRNCNNKNSCNTSTTNNTNNKNSIINNSASFERNYIGFGEEDLPQSIREREKSVRRRNRYAIFTVCKQHTRSVQFTGQISTWMALTLIGVLLLLGSIGPTISDVIRKR